MSEPTRARNEPMRTKAEQAVSDFLEALKTYSDHELTGNVSIMAHVSKGAIMKAEINYHHGIKFK